MILAKKFSTETAIAAHEGTILGANVLPDGVDAPFRHFYGYLENGGAMAGHAHPTDEIYHIMRGHGTVIIGGHCRDVKAGDIVVIPRTSGTPRSAGTAVLICGPPTGGTSFRRGGTCRKTASL